METIDSGPAQVVCDAGPVIHLDELGCLDLLQDFPRVILPGAVRREIEHHRPTALSHRGILWRHAAPPGPTSAALRVLVSCQRRNGHKSWARMLPFPWAKWPLNICHEPWGQDTSSGLAAAQRRSRGVTRRRRSSASDPTHGRHRRATGCVQPRHPGSRNPRHSPAVDTPPATF